MKMKTGLVLSILSTLFSLSAYEDGNPANPNQLGYLEASIDDLKKQMADLKEQCQEQAIYPPAGPAVSSGASIFITGDLLCWKANENGLGYVLKTKVVDPVNGILGNGIIATPHFDWDTGFRVGLGWNMGHDDWDAYLSWTRLHTAAHSHRHDNDGRFLFPVFADASFAENPTLKATAHLKLHLNVIDLGLGRSFYIGKHLSVRPHAGIENVWISQHYGTDYRGVAAFNLNPESDRDRNNISFRNHFWGIGARFGANTEWELRWGFSFYGDIAWALLYGNFNLKRTSELDQTALVPPAHRRAHTDEKFAQAKAALECALGFQWDCMFAHDRFHLGAKIGWEQHIYFGQNQIFTPVASPNLPGKIVGVDDDLTFQGFTFSLRFDL